MMNQHYPVMNREVLSLFKTKGRGIYIDCTVGLGGHAGLILKNIHGSKLIGIDVDEESIDIARKNLEEFGDRAELLKMEFKDIFNVKEIEWKNVKGVLVDPGLSMFQLRSNERGFSYIEDSKLDMRKDRSGKIDAEQVVNTFSEKDLSEIFKKYGDVKGSKGLAKRIIERRLFDRIDTTHKLKVIIEKFFGWKPAKGKSHPAAKVFQALRIFINNELEGVEKFIKNIPNYLQSGSLFVFLTYHSTEDRIIKKALKSLEEEKIVKLVKPFPMKPKDEEVRENFPSRSASLRAVELL